MTMGYLEGQVANSTWQDLVRTRIFQPLDMQRSDLSVDDMQKSSDFSQPYSVKDDVVTKVPFKNIDGIAPAGSINSSINEMSHYMILHLGDGTYEGKRIVSEKNLQLMHTGQTATPSGGALQIGGSRANDLCHGMGGDHVRGHHMVWHNGGIDGFHSLLTMLPEDKIGVVLLSNTGENMALEPIAYAIFDRLLGLSPDPWLDRYKALRDKTKKAEEEAKKNTVFVAKTGTQPSHPLADFAGEYVNPGYGTLKIIQNGDELTITLNQMGPYPFSRLHYDVFEIPEKGDSRVGERKGQFYMNINGDIDRLAMPLEAALPEDIIFTRDASKIDVLLYTLSDTKVGAQGLPFA